MSFNRHELIDGDKTSNKSTDLLGSAIPVLMSAIQLGAAVHKDSENNSTRNSAETGIQITSGIAGSWIGSWLGGYIGEKLKPEEGKKVGDFIGTIVGGLAASSMSSAVTKGIFDSVQYDMEAVTCEKCSMKFYARAYKGQSRCEGCT